MSLSAAPIAAFLASLVAATPQEQGGRAARVFDDPAGGLARAADANRDGSVDTEEWASFRDGLGADEAGAIAPLLLKLRLVELDSDGDGLLSRLEVEAVLPESEGEEPRRARTFLASLVRTLADEDRDGSVSSAERAAFLATLPADAKASIEEAELLDWLRRAQEIPPADRNALTPGVLLLGLDAALDADGDGRITLSDLARIHVSLDRNADGRIDASELASRASAGARGDFRVRESERQRPPAMPWQRNLEDALALVQASGKPLLLCVNMDGESASESLAFGRYRDPAFVELARGFVPLLASPDRREARERDDRGRRLPDRRFGRLLNSEHIDIEPELYERYFSGRRVAPRHVGVDARGQILFDLFLLQDLRAVDEKLREHGKPTPPDADPSTLEEGALLASPDAARRAELERRFVELPEAERVRLAGLALSAERRTQQPELLQLALRDPSPKVRLAGARNLAAHAQRAPEELFALAFARAAADVELRAELLAGTRAAAEAAPEGVRKRLLTFLARSFAAPGTPSPELDRERWRAALAAFEGEAEEEPGAADFDRAAERMDELAAASARAPEDLRLARDFAEACLDFARIQIAVGSDPTLFLEDARGAAARVLAQEPEDGVALAVTARARYLEGDAEAAGELAPRAIAALGAQAGSARALDALDLFATLRTRALYAAIGAEDEWQPASLASALAAYELALAHRTCPERIFSAYSDLCSTFALLAEQRAAIERGLARHPLSGSLHAHLRNVLLRDEGARALEAAYESEPLASAPADCSAALSWFHALATLLAAERDQQNRDPAAARAAYERCLARFERSIAENEDFAPSAAHYQTLALSALARLLADAGEHELAIAHLRRAFELSPDSLTTPDGLGRTPTQLAREIRTLLSRSPTPDLARTLDTLLEEATSER